MRKNIPTLILSIALLCPVLSVYAWGMTRTPEDRGPSSNISYTDAFSAFRGRACRETPGGEHSRGEAGIGLFASDKGLFGACAGDEGTLPVVPVVVNDSVESFLKYFQTTGRKHFERWLARAEGYDALVKSILRQEGLPEDLFYIAFIESGLNPKARSNRDAVGMWQFIKPTAVRYGLRVDWWVDERMDPEKATLAAAGYFKSLYERFGSWYLAAAGYNAGEGSVMRAIKRHDSARTACNRKECMLFKSPHIGSAVHIRRRFHAQRRSHLGYKRDRGKEVRGRQDADFRLGRPGIRRDA